MRVQIGKGRVKSKRDDRKGNLVRDDGFYVRVEYDNGDVGLYPSCDIKKWIVRVK